MKKMTDEELLSKLGKSLADITEAYLGKTDWKPCKIPIWDSPSGRRELRIRKITKRRRKKFNAGMCPTCSGKLERFKHVEHTWECVECGNRWYVQLEIVK